MDEHDKAYRRAVRRGTCSGLPRGHCGLLSRHMRHRFMLSPDPLDAFDCNGEIRPPVGVDVRPVHACCAGLGRYHTTTCPDLL